MSKQKLHLPLTVMDMVFMVQNFHAILSLCFWKSSHSASFLLGWCNHMFDNRLMYSSLQAADTKFFAKVLFAINSALQIHWRSCGTATDRSSVNDKVSLMQDTQDLTLRHNFIQQLPKCITDRFTDTNDAKEKLKQSLKNGGKFNLLQDKKDRKDLVTNNEKAYLKWRIKDGENYTNLFYKNQRKCPRNQDGKHICMKFFLCSFCEKSCTRAHKLSKEDEGKFDDFVNHCRGEGAAKPDF